MRQTISQRRASHVLLAVIVVGLLGLRHPCLASEPVEIGAGRVVLKFAADGRPKSLLADGKELLNEQDPGPGFELMGFDFAEKRPVSFSFKDLRWVGRQLVAAIKDDIRVTFDVTAADRYLAFRISRVEGVPKSSLLWLRFKMNTDWKMKTLPLDFMTKTAHWGCDVSWPWLWTRGAGTPLGGFALYAPSDAADEDETLLHLWANEGLPHPKIEGEWTVERARAWLAEWQREFADQSQLLITATTNAELYELADFAAKLDIRRIYMHTDTWNGEYWPYKHSFLHVNPSTFPEGEKDFQKFTAYARAKGIGLAIHTVSCPIANADPDYVVGTIDPRLAKWIEGTLARPAAPTDTTLLFKPAPGDEMPTSVGRPITGPAHVDPWNNIRVIRLGDEFVEVGKFTDTDREVWTLERCRRGLLGTTAVAHAEDARIIGLIRPYGQVFTADNDSTLVEELGRRIAEFYNRTGINHCEQDAAEIHTVNRPWGYAKFAEHVYTNVDHPITSNNSGGSHMPCQFEYRFNSSKAAVRARNQATVPLMLARNGRLATGPYEMCSGMGKAIASGVRSVGMHKPEPMFGVSLDILRTHGLSGHAAETALAWKRVAPLVSEEQCKAILAADENVLFRAAKTADGYEVAPLRMLFRPGIDIGWKTGSEFGPIVPRQYFQAGSRLAVENPYAEQEPEFLIRVMNGFGDSAPANVPNDARASQAAAPDKALVESYNIGAGIKPTDGAPPKASPSDPVKMILQPKAGQIRNVGDHVVADDGAALAIRFENKRGEAIRNEENLPFFECSAGMERARGIAVTVTGDGSRAILVLQAHCHGPRDYVIPLDFKGPRDVVIPCGEVSWSDARWGWRFATKGSQYGPLRRMSIGLGQVPPKTAVDISIRNLRLLPELPTALIDPVISVGTGTLHVTGTIASESYAWYRGGNTLGVYDANWRMIASLPVVKKNFVAPHGPLEIGVDSKGPGPMPWLESQFFVKDKPLIVREVTPEESEKTPPPAAVPLE
jgi:hypothetical protein